jgi:hypothetical protein
VEGKLKITLKAFLLSIGRLEAEIITYSGGDAMKAVESNGDALQYVNPAAFEPEPVEETTAS